ncbi:MAG: hypothetical protein RL264_1008 [Bacteroidota bacterium]|jgi:hypothetical protein
MKRCLSILFFLLFGNLAIAQDKSEIIQQRIEFITEQAQSEDLDLINIVERLNYYYDNPINLNTTQGDDLDELGLLTSVQINDLLLHRKAFGKYVSIYELQSLKYWDLVTIQMMLPFIRIDDKLDNLHISFREAIKQGRFELFLRLQPQLEHKSGYDKVPDSIKALSNNYYYGNAARYYTRFRYTYKSNISIGMTGEKDAGEQFFKGAQKNGFDFYSAHAFFKGGKYLRAVAVGDYQIQVGQGVNLWSSYAFGKTADIATIKRNAQSIRPYTSVDESRFLRGVAAEVGYKNTSFLLFASQKRIDANIQLDSTLEDLEFISTIDLTGLHRTNREIARKNGLTEQIAGANLKFVKGQLRLGTAAVYQGYNTLFNKTEQLYNQFDFRGKYNTSFSGDYSYTFRNVNVFGEISRNITDSGTGGWGMVHGALIALDAKASIGLMYRNYDKDYNTFYNAGFSEGSNTQNERGLYAGFKLKVSSKWYLQGYGDMFQFPWMRYLVDAPTAGHEYLIQSTYKPNKIFEFYFRFREQVRQRNSRFGDGTITEVEDILQRNYRFNLSYTVSEIFSLKTRLEYVTLQRPSSEKQNGILFYQDFIFRPKSSPIDLAFRYALFDTDSYDTRIYAFENNALYVFAVPAYFNQGSRAYAMVRYTFLKHFDLWVRYGFFLYNNVSSISSGAEEIKGSRKSDLVVQLRMSF